jgi:hypothetical protein
VAGTQVPGAVAVADGLSATATVAGTQVTGAVAVADGLSATATVAGTQVTGAVSVADGLSATATVAGTQVTGIVAAATVADGLSATATVAGTQVSGNIAGNAAGIINPISYTWRYYALNGMNNGINPGPVNTDGQGTWVVFNTDYNPTSYPIPLASGKWICPIAGVYLVNLNITGFADQPNGGLALSCAGRTNYDFCLFSAASINQNINTVAIMNVGDTIILSGTYNYTNIFSGVPGNVDVQYATMCITLLTQT